MYGIAIDLIITIQNCKNDEAKTVSIRKELWDSFVSHIEVEPIKFENESHLWHINNDNSIKIRLASSVWCQWKIYLPIEEFRLLGFQTDLYHISSDYYLLLSERVLWITTIIMSRTFTPHLHNFKKKGG